MLPLCLLRTDRLLIFSKHIVLNDTCIYASVGLYMSTVYLTDDSATIILSFVTK